MKEVRPTSGRVLAALFNILGELDESTKFLDIFAGTGRVGLEALRRGAGECVFVESVRARAEEIKRSAPENSLILSLEVRRALSWLIKREKKFNVIFADPPYNSNWPDTLITLPNLTGIFEPDAIFIIEHSSREPVTLANNPNNLELISTREYGETSLTFMREMT
ncbi:MAG: RsmD family RNA methyltransferase [Synergistaceae bacterium]|nr:RsmD family RNA methyltransferase [Synergistaceae bacterium]